MIELERVHYRYPEGEFELRIDALSIARGEQVAFVGPSGSGKTTLLRLLAGILDAAPGGRIAIDGTPITALGAAARRSHRITHMGLVFQTFALLDHLSVLENVLLPYRISSALRLDADAQARARALIDRVELGAHASRLVTRLSQGERQRVAVCRALVTEPDVVLADEPTGNLDPTRKHRILDLLQRYATDRGATLVTVTHDHGLLDRFERVVDFASLTGDATAAEPAS